MSTNPLLYITFPKLNPKHEKLNSFIEIGRKPRADSQNCTLCEERIWKDEWRVRALYSYFNAQTCRPVYCYSHLSCFLKTLKIGLKEEGLSIGIHKRTLNQLRKERVLAVLMHLSKKHVNQTTK